MNSANGSHHGETWTSSWLTKGKVERKVEVWVGGGPGPVGDWSGIWGTSLGGFADVRVSSRASRGWVSHAPYLVSLLRIYLSYHQCQQGYVSHNCLMVSSPVSPRHFIRQIKAPLLLLKGFLKPCECWIFCREKKKVSADKDKGFDSRWNLNKLSMFMPD